MLKFRQRVRQKAVSEYHTSGRSGACAESGAKKSALRDNPNNVPASRYKVLEGTIIALVILLVLSVTTSVVLYVMWVNMRDSLLFALL